MGYDGLDDWAIVTPIPVEARPYVVPAEQRPEGEADHSLPSTTEVRNAWSFTVTSPYACIAWCLRLGTLLSPYRHYCHSGDHRE